MLFFPSKTHDRLNGQPFAPELITGTVMVNPHHRGVTVADGTREVMIDSGAFQERDMLRRRTPDEALARQVVMALRLGQGMVTPPRFIAVTYDMLVGVDEAIIEGKRVKRRGTEQTAALAVEETIRSAAYYAANRPLGIAIAFSAQGATVPQYLRCAAELLDLMRPGDLFAFGGFCIIGMQPRLKPQFVETVRRVLPMLRRKGIHRAHILGVCVHDALIAVAALGSRHDVQLSTDSSSIEMNSIHGRVWDEAHMRAGRSPWRQVFGKEHKKSDGPVSYHPCRLAIENIERFSRWSASLEMLTAPHPKPAAQIEMFGELRAVIEDDHRELKRRLRERTEP